ncbi:MAG: type II toxin-antitoxin system death-on-curing family toxin [Chloroflexi bacterium]|nr:type II toxin-antitoxin system death-on-curing family toxin [Chloroflexota bacterium]
MIYLSAQQVLFINARLIAETGGETGLRDIPLLESAIARPLATFDGSDLYPGLFEKAAALLDSLVNNHPFVDGNKRTGITSAAMFLRINGYRIVCLPDELEIFTMRVAADHPPVQELAHWLNEHSQPA